MTVHTTHWEPQQSRARAMGSPQIQASLNYKVSMPTLPSCPIHRNKAQAGRFYLDIEVSK